MIARRNAVLIGRVVLLAAVMAGATPLRAQTDSTRRRDALSRAVEAVTQDSEPVPAGEGPVSKRKVREAERMKWEPVVVWRREAMIATAYSLICALILSIPVALVYRYTTAPADFDQSIAQSILILPATVAGIIIVVQGSLALAFSLAGVVTAVRFRSSLKDTNDATFIFLSVAIGVAAGARALDIAVVVTVIVCLAMLVANRKQFVMCLPRGSHPPAAAEPDNGSANDMHVFRVNVHAASAETRPAIEAVMTSLSKGFLLTDAGLDPDHPGGTRLVYGVRVKKKVDVDAFREALEAVATSHGATIEVFSGPAA